MSSYFHTCGEVTAVAESMSSLLDAGLDLIEVQQMGLDGTTEPLSAAKACCDLFAAHHPSMTLGRLIEGLDTSTTQLSERVRFEKNEPES